MIPRSNVDGRIPIAARAPRFHPGTLETRVLYRVDGVRDVATIARLLGLTAVETMTVLQQLETLGAIRWADVVTLPEDALIEEMPSSEEETAPNRAFERPTVRPPPP